MGLRSSDMDAIPLCKKCHDMFHEDKRLTKEKRMELQEKWLAKTKRLLHLICTDKEKIDD